jgi:hypothetical protein
LLLHCHSSLLPLRHHFNPVAISVTFSLADMELWAQLSQWTLEQKLFPALRAAPFTEKVSFPAFTVMLLGPCCVEVCTENDLLMNRSLSGVSLVLGPVVHEQPCE